MPLEVSEILVHRTLFTAGYGNQLPSFFMERLKSFDINLIFDVRRKEAHSWYPEYRPGNFNIGALFKHFNILYWFLLSYSSPKYDYGNRFDTLDEYYNWISSHPKALGHLQNLAVFIEGNTGIIPCLLCAERSHEKCHRTIVADQLLKYVNAITTRDHTTPWKIQHI